MPAKPLTPEQKADAARLKELFLKFKASRDDAGDVSSQEGIGAQLGLGQSALNQYLGGKIPLNPNMLRKFCELMGCKPWDISPTIYQAERASASYWLSDDSAPVPAGKLGGSILDPEAEAILPYSSPEQVALIRSTARAILGLPLGKVQPPPQENPTNLRAS